MLSKGLKIAAMCAVQKDAEMGYKGAPKNDLKTFFVRRVESKIDHGSIYGVCTYVPTKLESKLHARSHYLLLIHFSASCTVY